MKYIMIMRDVFKYIQSDYYRYSEEILYPLELFVKAMWCRNHCFRYSFWMRLASLQGAVGLISVSVQK